MSNGSTIRTQGETAYGPVVVSPLRLSATGPGRRSVCWSAGEGGSAAEVQTNRLPLHQQRGGDGSRHMGPEIPVGRQRQSEHASPSSADLYGPSSACGRSSSLGRLLRGPAGEAGSAFLRAFPAELLCSVAAEDMQPLFDNHCASLRRGVPDETTAAESLVTATVTNGMPVRMGPAIPRELPKAVEGRRQFMRAEGAELGAMCRNTQGSCNRAAYAYCACLGRPNPDAG